MPVPYETEITTPTVRARNNKVITIYNAAVCICRA